MSVVPVRLNGRSFQPHKAIVRPLLGTRTVLTNSPWAFVSLWLKRESKEEALFFWDQARQFYTGAAGMTLESSPLLLYYSFMNATKALLVAKGIAFSPMHGISEGARRTPNNRIALSNEKVLIKLNGILPALSSYLGETESQRTHSLKDLFFNLPFVHRTYCLTYKNQAEMFIPLTDCEYVIETKTKEVYFRAKLSKDFAHARYYKRLPPSLAPDPAANGILTIRSTQGTTIAGRSVASQLNKDKLAALNRSLRSDIQYINGAQALWYAKGIVAGPKRLARFPLTITLAAMHRLSEICRYKPIELQSFLAGQRNWLLSEFIQLAPGQFIDELAAEITGHQFLAPNVRPAS
jgi:YaaC-like Protein